jgi:hypothetical protein
MDWIEANLEAYRNMTEVLVALRQRLLADLNTGYGEDWLTKGIPTPVQERLAGKKDREDTVAWYSSGERGLFEYVDFFDMAEVLEGQGAGIELLAGVFPQQQILRARLMELQVVAQKLGHGHAVTDEELSLLTNLRIRLNLPSRPGVRQTAPGGSAPLAAAETPAPVAVPPEPAPIAPLPPPTSAAPAPTRAAAPSVPVPAPPTPSPTPKPAPQPIPVPFPAQAAPSARAAKADHARSAPPTPSFEEVVQAMDRRQNPIVLRALYAEIMAAAEAVWARGAATSLKVWYAVRESPWYQEQFVALGLKPVSDFYSIIEDLQTNLGFSPTKEKVQEFLAGRAFAQVLLSLRELFQRALKT